MKYLPLLFILLLAALPTAAQTSFSAGINGFSDLGPNGKIRPNSTEEPIQFKDYHRSLYADMGLNTKIIDQFIDWSVGAGGTYQIGSEQFLSSAVYYDGALISYDIEKTSISRFGIFVRSTVDFGAKVNLNMTVYRFEYWGEYMSLGPSFRLN